MLEVDPLKVLSPEDGGELSSEESRWEESLLKLSA